MAVIDEPQGAEDFLDDELENLDCTTGIKPGMTFREVVLLMCKENPEGLADVIENFRNSQLEECSHSAELAEKIVKCLIYPGCIVDSKNFHSATKIIREVFMAEKMIVNTNSAELAECCMCHKAKQCFKSTANQWYCQECINTLPCGDDKQLKDAVELLNRWLRIESATDDFYGISELKNNTRVFLKQIIE